MNIVPEYKVSLNKYYCKKIKSKVLIERKVLAFDCPDLWIDKKEFPVSFDCDKKFTCGITNKACSLISFDWEGCIHNHVN